MTAALETSPVPVAAASAQATFRLRIAAEELLLRRPADQPGRIARALRRAMIDLNPHQVDAAVAALGSLRGKGLVLADEVGLGKTIEAGLVLAQLTAESKRHLLVITPATLRLQWAQELMDKLGLESTIVDGPTAQREKRAGKASVFDRPGEIVIASHPFAARRADELRAIRWDCVIVDEAHRLRGAHRGSKMATALRAALDGRPKLLLTATPLQNGLGELYGILSLLDVDLLGPFEDFRRTFPDAIEQVDTDRLRARVQPFIHRTLRRQVREYVRYTDRKSIVCEFTPTRDESTLYEEVSAYLAEPDTLAIDPARRPLMVMVYRKLLASSPAAIAGTLAKLADGLRQRLERGAVDPEVDGDVAQILQILEDDGYGDEEAGTGAAPARPAATPRRLEAEIARLDRLAALAASIKRPAKMEALLTALSRAFIDAASRGWPEKAVIFTESRRTQDALQAALEGAGFAGHVLLLHGGSGDARARGAIVERFRTHAKILILTEAGAEGLNLQFANLIVNYDLPWNPQRIEQRIGRCHRYGQTRDVVVLNFLASDNAAEARLYELLARKLQLFDGVFGTTDEPLGALGDGAGFEKRIFEILQSCRDPSTINSAFDALQMELEDRIEERMSAAKASILDTFDDEIRARLKMTGDEAELALARDEETLLSLVTGALDGARLDERGRLHLPSSDSVIETSRRSRTKGADFLTVDHPVAAGLIARLREQPASEVRYVAFEYTRGGHKISRLANLVGSEGWWLVYRVSFEGAMPEDHLVHVVLLKKESGEVVVLDEAQTESLLTVRATEVEKRPRLRAATLASTHAESALAPRLVAIDAGARTRNAAEVKKARESIDLAFEDRLRALQYTTQAAVETWAVCRSRGDEHESSRLLRDLQRVMQREAEERAKAFAKRSERLLELQAREKVAPTRVLIATAYLWLE